MTRKAECPNRRLAVAEIHDIEGGLAWRKDYFIFRTTRM
jgi:hypothetical protein